MPKRAERLSLLFETPTVARLPGGFASALAGHLVGTQVSTGHKVCLPGWPQALVDLAEPDGSVVGPGTRVQIHAPPPATHGALSLAFLVDASLTMGKGGKQSHFQQAAQLVDAVLLNGRTFIANAGIVVQGGTTREVEDLRGPEDLAGASILKATPKGTFDIEQGIGQAVDLLAGAENGPRAILLITDGSDAPREHLPVARPAMHAGVVVVALTHKRSKRLDALCQATGGLATTEAEGAFDRLAELAGTRAQWIAPASPQPDEREPEEPYEFEVVIEAVET